MATWLTEEQRATIDAVCERMHAQAMSTEPVDRDRCRAAVTRAYQAQQLAVPEIEFHVSPLSAMTRLMACAPEDGRKIPRPQPDLARLQAGDLSTVFDLLRAAQPACWPALGEEIDTACAHELRHFHEHLPWDRRLTELVQRRVAAHSRLEAFRSASEAVRECLEERVVSDATSWLLYTAAHQSLWSEAVPQAVLESTLALGTTAAMPATVAASRELIPLNVSLYTFEKLCLVCERPATLDVAMDSTHTYARITWRDGSRSEYEFEYDDEGEDEPGED
jgi:hypothetical protein